MAANKEVTVIIFDVGKNAAERETKDGPSFFEAEKDCVQKILLRKIFTKPKDEVSLLLIGSEITDNDLNVELGGYEHIATGFPMAPANWQMFNYVEKSIDPPSKSTTGDWMDGIVVAMNYLRSLESPKSTLKIILLTTFSTPVLDDQIEVVVAGLKGMNIELIAITSNIDYMKDAEEDFEYPVFSQTLVKDKTRQKSESTLTKLIDQCDGTLCGFSEALPQLVYFDKKQRRRVPWNSDLEIGQNYAIKIAAYIFLREEKEIGSWKFRSRNGEKVSAKMEHFLNDEFIEPESLVENVIKGYRFGDAIVPYEETDDPKTGRKSLVCIGFTKKVEFSELYLAGTGIWAVVPQKGYQVSANMLTALVAAMRKTGVAMIARYTYSASSAPKMMILFPNDMNKKHPEHNSLLMYELFFKQNYIKVEFPSFRTKNTEPSAEQYEVMDKFIDSMDLMKTTAGDDVEQSHKSHEAFKKLLDPALQHMYRAIANRAINPKDPVLAVDKDLKDLLYPPSRLQERAKPHIERAKELFPLEVAKKSTKCALFEKLQSHGLNAQDNIALMDGAGDSTDNIIEIGTASPAEDFAELMNRGERFPTLAAQIQKVIMSIVFQSVEMPEEKVSKALLIYREFAKDKGPFRYNEWIESFKAQLLERGKVDVWQKIIVAERYGLITAAESEISTVTDSEAAQFYQIAVDNTDKMDDEEDDSDIDDLLADM